MIDLSTNLGSRLREARRARGISQVEAAAGLGISRPTLIAVEQGRRQPTTGELVDMARIYGRQVHELVRESQPVEALSVRFRLDPGTEDETRAAVDTMQRVADDVLELESLLGASAPRAWAPPYDVSGLPLDVAASQVAESERRRLGLGSGPLSRLRDILEEDFGVRVFAVDLPSRIAGLFAVAEPVGACVAINARHPHERQRWTLAHELGHFLLHRESPEVTMIDPTRGRGERLAEAFAACFLLPDDGLTRRFQSARQARGGQFTAVDLLQLAAHYEVSAQAMALRLEGLHLVVGGWWESLIARGFRVQDAREQIGIEQSKRDTELLPLRSQYLAVGAYLDGALSEGLLARTLHADRVTARETVRRLAGSSDVAAEGSLQSWVLQPAQPEGSID